MQPSSSDGTQRIDGGVWSAAQIQKVSPQSLSMAGNTSPCLKKRRPPCAGVYHQPATGARFPAATRSGRRSG